jgi:hypothetical protein
LTQPRAEVIAEEKEKNELIILLSMLPSVCSGKEMERFWKALQ